MLLNESNTEGVIFNKKSKMSAQQSSEIQHLAVQNFTCFENVQFSFSKGINLFIGENGTGKTHILKILYSIFNNQTQKYQFANNPDRKGVIGRDPILEDFPNVFHSDGFHVQRDRKLDCYIQAVTNNNRWSYQFNDFRSGNSSSSHEASIDCLYMPCQEMLSLYKGFIASYENRENSFDRTYYDLAKKLNARPLKGKALDEAQKLLLGFEDLLGIKIEERNDQFYITFEKEKLEVEAPLVAEGIKKLGQMIYLIRNGSLTKDTILFWDEPEVNLNPKYIRLVAEFLMTLAKNGVQIFVATHDYQLAHYLSIKAEYPERTNAPQMKFFSFYKTENGTQIESGETLAGIQNNTLLDEYSALYELESGLFQQTVKQ